MKIIIGHSNVDPDCLASLLLARYLYPDYQVVMSRLIHPVARNLYNLYQYHLNYMSPTELKKQEIDEIIIVDTRSRSRLKEYFDVIGDFTGKVTIYDHHPDDLMDFNDAKIHGMQCGATVTILGLELMKRGITLTNDDATIALTGLYSDTGNFCHESVTADDLKVASWLLEQGGSVKMVKSFLKSLKVDYQLNIFHELLNRIDYRNYNGHKIILTYMELEKQVGGLAAVVEKAFDVEAPDAIFSIFYFLKERDTVIIARSQVESIDVNRILQSFGGGGHPMASSALLKKRDGKETLTLFERYLAGMLVPALTAADIMSSNVYFIMEDWSLLDASVFLEEVSHTGAPVIDHEHNLTGVLSLRDIMKGRKAGQMQIPVKAFMTRNVMTVNRDTTIREIETIMFDRGIGHLPVVDDGNVIGIITRTDYLAYLDRGSGAGGIKLSDNRSQDLLNGGKNPE